MVLTETTAPGALEELAGREPGESVPDGGTNARGAFWAEAVAPYAVPNLPRSIAGLLTSVVPYLALLVAMYESLQVTYVLTLAIGVLALAAYEIVPKLASTLAFVTFHVNTLTLCLELLTVGAAVGLIASWFSVGRYLRA